jgi:hypothetical protein
MHHNHSRTVHALVWDEGKWKISSSMAKGRIDVFEQYCMDRIESDDV